MNRPPAHTMLATRPAPIGRPCLTLAIKPRLRSSRRISLLLRWLLTDRAPLPSKPAIAKISSTPLSSQPATSRDPPKPRRSNPPDSYSSRILSPQISEPQTPEAPDSRRAPTHRARQLSGLANSSTAAANRRRNNGCEKALRPASTRSYYFSLRRMDCGPAICFDSGLFLSWWLVL